MRELDRPRLLVDFNELVERDVVLLSREDAMRDSDGKLVPLRAGLRVYLYMHDADERGAPRLLLATGIVEPHVGVGWSSPARWSCRIDLWNA